MLGHAYTVAAPEAQEAVKLAAQQLTVNGPIGPYTSVADAARYATAVVHLAVIQAAAGLPEAAGQTVASFAELREQVGSRSFAEALSPSTVVWALACTARGALAGDDVATANAYADAALQQLAEVGLPTDPAAAYVVVDADRLVSDARWVVGLTDDALTHLHAARETYDRVVDGRLAQPGRLSPALLQRLAEPLFGVYLDLALDRLLAVGEVDLGLVTRRQLIDLLGGLATKDETARVQLAGSLGDLVRDRSARPGRRGRAGRRDPGGPPGAGAQGGGRALDRDPARQRGGAVAAAGPGTAYAGATASTASSVAALEAELKREAADRLAAERSVAQRLEQERLEEAVGKLLVGRPSAPRPTAGRPSRRRPSGSRRPVASSNGSRRPWAETEGLAAEAEAERRERQRRREERIEAHRLEEERIEAERLEAERAAFAQREAERRAADPAEIERLELERLQAEIAELERAEASRPRTLPLKGLRLSRSIRSWFS